MLALGVIGGMAWAAIPAFLKNRFSANEILTSLMLVYVAQLFLDWLVRGPWRDPQGFNFPKTVNFRRLAAAADAWGEPSTSAPCFAPACAGVVLAFHDGAHAQGLRDAGAWERAARRALRRLLRNKHA